MGISQKIREFVSQSDDDDVLELDENEAASISDYETSQSKNLAKVTSDTKMVLFEPRSFDEAEEVARRLKENRAAVVN
ncbi:MAG: cell division protein SepF, partial [Erysipelotrichaceae bacterium]